MRTGVRPYKKQPLAIRVERYIERITESGCWLWTGASISGYGAVNLGVEGGVALAHRVLWEITFGPIPAGLFACHRCDVRRCVNPHHLFLGTNADNMADCHAKGRESHGSKRPAAKLTEEQVREIRARSATGESNKDLAREYGVVRQIISSIALGKAWRRA